MISGRHGPTKPYVVRNMGDILKHAYPAGIQQFPEDRPNDRGWWKRYGVDKEERRRRKRFQGDHRRWSWIAKYGSVESGVFWECGLGALLPDVEGFC